MLQKRSRELIVVLLLVALLLRQGLAVLLLGLLGLVLLAVLLWSRWALQRVVFERRLSAERGFVGDQVTLTQRVSNRKPLGLPSLQIDDSVPAQLEYPDADILPHAVSRFKTLRRWTQLRSYEAVSWNATLNCTKRGLFEWGPVRLAAADAFGLESVEHEQAAPLKLLVYPELLPLPELPLLARHPLGDARARRQLLTDPSRTIGVRDYRRDDPFKAIHWGATARRGELQTRVFEPTTNLSVVIVLNLDTFEHYWEGMRYDQVETMISAAATVATRAADERLSFGLYSNGASAGSGQLVRIAPGRTHSQLEVVMESLARLIPFSIMSFPTLLQRLGPSLDWGATIVLINAVASEPIKAELLRLQRGRRIVWLWAGSGPAPGVPGVDVVAIDASVARWQRRPAAGVAPTATRQERSAG